MGNREIIAIYNQATQLMRIIQHFYLNVTINHHWAFVISTVCDPVEFGEMMRQKYIVSNIWEEFCGKDMQLQLLWGEKEKWANVTSSVINYCCQKVIRNVIVLLLKGVTSRPNE